LAGTVSAYDYDVDAGLFFYLYKRGFSMKVSTLLPVVALVLASASAFAQQSQYDLDLYSTGINVDANGIDLSYTYSTNDIDSRLSALSGQAALAIEGVHPMTGANWLLNDSQSKWITPDPVINQGVGVDGFLAGSDWVYTTTFNILDFTELSTVVISGRWIADNEGVDILLNGQSIGFKIANQENIFMDWTDFEISSAQGNNYAQIGQNTLSFVVRNSLVTAGPSGLRAEVSGTATVVPEPETWAMLLAGLGLVGKAVRRRKQH
jgi:hypothetical protein